MYITNTAIGITVVVGAVLLVNSNTPFSRIKLQSERLGWTF
ncbi:hypothetical protein [Chamaesiphon sp. VAR_48_metabat_403]|nr:hypothetical protein [Chamaesiphon sp. VAR_48_metabat_403]